MKQYTVRGLKEVIAIHPAYTELSKTGRKHYFIDKCNWLITKIVNQNYSVDEQLGGYANIHSQSFKDYLGRSYKNVQDVLSNCSVIKINDSYSEGNFSKSFRLTKKAIGLGIVETEFLSKRFENHYNKVLNEKYDRIIQNPLFEKIINNSTQLKIAVEYIDFVTYLAKTGKHGKSKKNFRHRLGRYSDYYIALKKLNQTEDPKELTKSPIWFFPSKSNYGRVYHLVASIPRIHRRCMVHSSGKDLYEVDMASAQPTLLILEWIRTLKNSGEVLTVSVDQEVAKALNLVLTGGLYKYIQENSKYCSDLEYQSLKRDILTTLNADYKPTNLTKELTDLFPNFMGWIRSTKNEHGNAEISHIGQSAEAEVFVNTYKKLPNDIFCLLIHDSILCLKRETKLVKDRLCKRTRNLYSDIIESNQSLDSLFKVSRVSMDFRESETYKIMKDTIEKRSKRLDEYEALIEEIAKDIESLACKNESKN